MKKIASGGAHPHCKMTATPHSLFAPSLVFLFGNCTHFLKFYKTELPNWSKTFKCVGYLRACHYANKIKEWSEWVNATKKWLKHMSDFHYLIKVKPRMITRLILRLENFDAILNRISKPVSGLWILYIVLTMGCLFFMKHIVDISTWKGIYTF